jgi:hypothetical protein
MSDWPSSGRLRSSLPNRPARRVVRPMPASSRLLTSLCLATLTTHAAVVRVEITERANIPQSEYEQLSGRLHFEIDPKLPQNAIIADVNLAPVNAAGKVCCTADLRLWKPKDESAA